MMRKFSKILAVVLAFAMVLCPVLTASAETTETANSNVSLTMSEVVDGAATVTVRVESDVAFNAVDFKLNFAKGITYADEVALVFDEEESGDEVDIWSVQESYVDGILSVLSIDDASMACSTNLLVFDIAVNVENASDYDLYLTKIFAVGAGSADTDEEIAVFPYADNGQSGVIDVEAARIDCPAYFVSNVCAHANVVPNIVPPTCTEDGSSVEICKDCGTVISNDILRAPGHYYNKDYMLVEDTEDTVGYLAYDALCENCDAKNPKYFDEEGNVLPFDAWSEYVGDDKDVIEVDKIVGATCDTATELSKDATGHWYDCSCGEKHDFAEHIAADAVKENEVAATVTTAGSYDSVVYCSVCNYEISRTTVEVPATNLYVNYTKVAYDLTANKLTLTYGAPGAEFKAALSAGGKASAGRTVHLVVRIGEGNSAAEFTFAGSVSSGGGSMAASGFALSHMSQKVTLFIRVANANTGYLWESNAYEIVVADYLTEQYNSGADTSAKLAAWIDLYNVYQQGNASIAISNANIETGAVNYTAIKYDTDSSKITVSYGAPGTEFKGLLSAGGKASAGRVVELIVQIGEGKNMAEFAFAGSVSSGGGSMAASGFSLSHYDINVKMFVRISNANTGYLAETNAVTVNLADVMAASDSAYAAAYNAYAAA